MVDSLWLALIRVMSPSELSLFISQTVPMERKESYCVVWARWFAVGSPW
jgi:hypothetical protein